MRPRLTQILMATVALSMLFVVPGLAESAATPAVTPAVTPDTEVTYHRDIEPIFQRNCQSCHRSAEGVNLGGMIAPMALETYKDVRPWSKSIAKKVLSRDMPPWFADKKYDGIFDNQRTLTDAEVDMVVQWAKAGAPQGDPADAPAPVDRSEAVDGWTIGEPDLIISLDEPFFVDDDVRDLNITLKAEMITKEMLPEARYIEAMEFKTGGKVVHHIVASKNALESERPGASGLLGGVAPGTDPFKMPEGFGRLLVPGTQVWLNMHFNKEPGEDTGVWDRSQVAFKFKKKSEEVKHVVEWTAIGNDTFEIPPNTANWEVGASQTFPQDVMVFALLPHMHLRGRYARYTAHYPDGTAEDLLEVPNYDWNWQTNYQYKEPKFLPAGTRIEVTMQFDNTPEREAIIASQGTKIDHSRAVSFGGPTYDEMMLGFLDFAVVGDGPAKTDDDDPMTDDDDD